MSLFRNIEGHDGENSEVKKPKNQILQTPEKQEGKAKLDRFQDKSPEEQKKSLDNQSKAAENFRNKLKVNKPTDGDDDSNKGERIRERGRNIDMDER